MTDLPTTAEELGDLAQAGAIALVGVMATGAFEAAREGVARLFSRQGPGQELNVQLQLDGDEELVVSAEESERDQVREELASPWRRRLTRLLADHPDAEQQLRDLLSEWEPVAPEHRQYWVQNVIATDHSTANVALGGNVIRYELTGRQLPLASEPPQ